MTTALYIGAGLDVRPVRALEDIRRFIYVDSRPASQQPPLLLNRHDPSFVSDFDRKMEALGFYVPCASPSGFVSGCFWFSANRERAPRTLEYVRGPQTLVYHLNSPFPQVVPAGIGEADTLVIAGFHPHRDVLKHMKTPVHVVCWDGTSYANNDYNDNHKHTVVQHLHRDMSDVSTITWYKKEYVGREFKRLCDICAA